MPGKPGPCGESKSGANPDTVPDQRKNRRSAVPLSRWLSGPFLFTQTPARRDSLCGMWGHAGRNGGPVPGEGGAKMDGLKKYQIHCPKCRYEFVWNMDELEQEREKLKKRHGVISQMISDMKAHNEPTVLGMSKEFKRLKAESTQIIERMTELKTIKKNNDAITSEIFNREFKDLIRERFGEEEYCRLLEMVQERLKPIRTEQIMTERK